MMARELADTAVVERQTQQLRELVQGTAKMVDRPVVVPLARPQPDGTVLLPDGSTVGVQPREGAK